MMQLKFNFYDQFAIYRTFSFEPNCIQDGVINFIIFASMHMCLSFKLMVMWQDVIGLVATGYLFLLEVKIQKFVTHAHHDKC